MALVLTALPVCAGDLLWPLPLARALSSSFGESRSTAFHAGIDVKTWGRTGYEVRAVDGGHIERLRTSPWGYGRAVYLRLKDGRVAVYAHLEAFAPALAARVERAQKESGRYSVDLWFKEGELNVERGDIVAYSGQSGAGPPHLHLELRDANNIPFNPLLGEYEIEDSTAPVFQRVGFVPFGMESRANGQAAPTSIALRWDEDKQVYSTKKKVQIHGRVGINALVWDRADAATNKLAPYTLKLWVDGREIFAAAYGRVSYTDAHQVQLDRMYIDYAKGRGRFFNLFRRPGNRLEFYQSSTDGLLRSAAGSGAAFLAEGEHVVEVVAEDAFGNSSRAYFEVVVNAAPTITASQIAKGDKGWILEAELDDVDDALLEAEIFSFKKNKWQSLRSTAAVVAGKQRWPLSEKAALWKLVVRDAKGAVDSVLIALPGQQSAALARMQVEMRPRLDWVELALGFEKPLSQQPRVSSNGKALIARQVGHSQYIVSVPLLAQSEEPSIAVVELGDRRRRIELMQVAVRPQEVRSLSMAEDNVELAFSANSVYELFFPQVESFSPTAPKGLEVVSMGYALGPDVQFDARVGVRLRYRGGEEPTQRIGLYEEVGAEKWVLVGSEWDEEWVEARLRKLGRFALLADVVAPQIESLRPKKNAKLKERRPLLRARIEDLESGIGREEDIAVELDGQLLIVEYDPEAKEIRARPDGELAVGKHEWTVRVRDMGGNERVRKSAFRVVK